ncbi:hypothetical protein E3P81_01492 [Wallemia ichthyophaga]|uniref:KOW domain-containing protein n=2 Tax=Wallemia ichthyophaga TaxID=245174 RepID=A0A4T0EIG5_WALIC|nr:hypothetical protein E3P91_01187 [Wallemia ichthyophaga]TIA82606.1 hypothetical protein E3P98_01327 [Wallemia ichthyophaga]TIA92399.1 hypothetical protein E3P97_01493 [Wallemia ichthyophaga]TIB00120.1 hypothetical protein E3P96_02730 [Wallemia ichthyophaga]TIB01518.1 hypothetical protein E3P95_01329 [Wallemia ichthyophaga]
MKFSRDVSSSRRVNRKAHFAAPSSERRKLMASSLNKELRKEHNIRSLPIRRDDEVLIVRGSNKGKEGKVVQVQRNKFAIFVDRVHREKANGQTSPTPIHPSSVVITNLKLDKGRMATIERKSVAKKAALEARNQTKDVNMSNAVLTLQIYFVMY